jgi:hypothetical protein
MPSAANRVEHLAWVVAGTLGLGCTLDMENTPVGRPSGITGVGDSAGEGGDGADDGDGGTEVDEVPPASRSQLRRLTRSQYVHALHDLLGEPLEIPAELEPDLVLDLFASVGAAHGTVSALGVERFEGAADDVADEVFADAARRAAVVGCEPATAGCLATFAASFGRRAFRRPLTADEASRYAQLAQDIAALRGDPWEGARSLVVALLSSPSFLYQIELGEPDPDDATRWRFTSVEMASRLSFAIWNGPPDEALLAAGEAGELVDETVVREQAERLLADPRAQRGIRRFAAEWLGLDAIPMLDKDVASFPAASPELFASMHGEATRLAEEQALRPDASLLDLFRTTHTYVDARLATFYGVAMPADVDAEGFGRVELPQDKGRRGILGAAGVLASQSRRTRTSPTLRGLFVQTRFRCEVPPPPPPDVEMDIPEQDAAEPQTIRELLEEHRENPACASCHDRIDPPGLVLENYDAMGAWRTTEAGLAIDASTTLDGVPLDGLPDLAAHLESDPAVEACFVRQLYRFTIGHLESEAEEPVIEALTESLALVDHNLVAFLPSLMVTPSFRTLAPPSE